MFRDVLFTTLSNTWSTMPNKRLGSNNKLYFVDVLIVYEIGIAKLIKVFMLKLAYVKLRLFLFIFSFTFAHCLSCIT